MDRSAHTVKSEVISRIIIWVVIIIVIRKIVGLRLVGLPDKSIAFRNSAIRDNRKEPQNLIFPENLQPILVSTQSELILDPDDGVQGFDRRRIIQNEFDMKLKEEENQYSKDIHNQISRDHDDHSIDLTKLELQMVKLQCQRVNFVEFYYINEDHKEKEVEQELHEELPVVEANAVIDPRTVMVHIEHTDVADWAVMASLRLEGVTDQAISFTFRVLVSDVEAPI